MIVITDSNEVISALIQKNGVVARIFRAKSNIQFIAPNYIIDEVKNHYSKIEKLSNLSKKELKTEFEWLLSRIKIIDTKKIPKKYLFEALQIVRDVDYDDLFFVALNRYKGYKIWSSDKELIKGVEAKGYKIFITTSELKKHLYKIE
ncbi:MAG: PIN domain nuclease [Brumimicrobium sp.]|nr:PIN domain nuclease [Brumimicrobium sp.]